MECSIETLFAEKNFSPDENQRRAIMHNEGPLFLNVCPGSGNSDVILWRTLNLIVFHGVSHSEIFLSTITKKEALHLKKGLVSLLSLASKYTGKNYDISGMYIGHFNSLCMRILTAALLDSSSEESGFKFLDADDQFLFVSCYKNWKRLLKSADPNINVDSNKERMEEHSVINEWFGEKSASKMTAARNCISFFNRLSAEDLDDGQIEKAIEKADEVTAGLLNMALTYRELLNEDGLEKCDSYSLQQKALSAINRSRSLAKKFRHVIASGFQNATPVQQKIILSLADHCNNIFVAGDEDQTFYRDKGADAGSFLDFEKKCGSSFFHSPVRINLNVNYRSRPQIVEVCNQFMEKCAWNDKMNPGTAFRTGNKKMHSHRGGENPSVLHSFGTRDEVVEEVSDFVIRLKEEGKIPDYNQCAFVFPVLREKDGEMNSSVKAYCEVFRKKGVPVYAPAAMNFLSTDECLAFFGTLAMMLRIEPECSEQTGGFRKFCEWIALAKNRAGEIIKKDPAFSEFVKSKTVEMAQAEQNYISIASFCRRHGMKLEEAVDESTAKNIYYIGGLSSSVKTKIHDFLLAENYGMSVASFIENISSVDWTLMDLFYEMQKFSWFSGEYAAAQDGSDAGLYNLARVSKCISKYMESREEILTGRDFTEEGLEDSLYYSFLYSLFRKDDCGCDGCDESEIQIPKGALPFLSPSQAAGSTFPVVVLGSLTHRKNPSHPLEACLRKMHENCGRKQGLKEPLEMADDFDAMRTFYLAMSRADNLLVISHLKGMTQSTYAPFEEMLSQNDFLRPAESASSDFYLPEDESSGCGRVYDYAEDYIEYRNCPRNYALSKKYGFAPSRNRGFFYETLVRKAIDDVLDFESELKEFKNKSETDAHAKVQELILINEVLDFNSDYLKEMYGHSLNGDLKADAYLEVVLHFNLARPALKEERHQKISFIFPESRTPCKKIPYAVTDCANYGSLGGKMWLYNLTVRSPEKIKLNEKWFRERLCASVDLWTKESAGKKIDGLVTVSTFLTGKIRGTKGFGISEEDLEGWNPTVTFEYKEDGTERFSDKFGAVVEQIESRKFPSPPIEKLGGTVPGSKESFSNLICEKCDFRFSCPSYLHLNF